MSYDVFGDNDAFDDDWPEKAAEHGWYSPDDLSAAEKDVIRERARQVDLEGFDLADDDRHTSGELVAAAICYATLARTRGQLTAGGMPEQVIQTSIDAAGAPGIWPWDRTWWKPKDPRRDLVRATALLIAEIERLDRVSAETKGA